VSTVLFLFCFEVYFGISVCMHSGLLNFLVFSLNLTFHRLSACMWARILTGFSRFSFVF
jgi:hypothetical protein